MHIDVRENISYREIFAYIVNGHIYNEAYLYLCKH